MSFELIRDDIIEIHSNTIIKNRSALEKENDKSKIVGLHQKTQTLTKMLILYIFVGFVPTLWQFLDSFFPKKSKSH